MLAYFVDDIAQRLATRQENEGWQVSPLLPPHPTSHSPTFIIIITTVS
jgi:hypothetical protein